ncbi:MAG TPA: hypothetical protein VKG43_08765 [Acidimicrobiales bacterium]|nr:hypothetical protein [Acidimicrobiales bacterium]
MAPERPDDPSDHQPDHQPDHQALAFDAFCRWLADVLDLSRPPGPRHSLRRLTGEGEAMVALCLAFDELTGAPSTPSAQARGAHDVRELYVRYLYLLSNPP